jgi:hypothetical protein
MNSGALIDRIARAVLYEGYILYPYRQATKNRQRWTFGAVCPRSYSEAQNGSDAWTMQTQCIVLGGAHTSIEVRVRFLRLIARTVGELPQPLAEPPPMGDPFFRTVESLEVDGRRFQTWQEAEEQEIRLDGVGLTELLSEPRRRELNLPGSRESEPIRDSGGQLVGLLIREREPIQGFIELSAENKGSGAFALTVRIVNLTPMELAAETSRDDAMMRSLVSAHTILSLRDGEFVSLIDPPDALRALAAECRNVGAWPVLVGEAGAKDAILSAPIILYDYPEVAPESPGDLFDGSEIDEILTLRILTLTDDEKREVAAVDDRARDLLARTEALAREQLMSLHGTIRQPRAAAEESQRWQPMPEPPPPQKLAAGAAKLRPGDRVRLWPRRRADILDIALRGKIATIANVERDYENRIHLAVIVDDDPGSDFGQLGKPAHRFFFSPDEVEALGQQNEDCV